MATEKEIQNVQLGERDSLSEKVHAGDTLAVFGEYEGRPTDEQLRTLRRVPGPIPYVAMAICAVEFCERASYYGIQQLITNFVKQPLPVGGNGWGSPPLDSQKTAGALGLGSEKSNAIRESFNTLVYFLPLLFGWVADKYTGRFRLITYGVAVFGVAHVLLVGAASKSLLENGMAKAPYLIGLYMLCIGAAMFKPCVSPLLLDQISTKKPVVKVTKKGETVIEDPESTNERVMLWFYLLINIGGFTGVATSYSAKYVGFWLAFLIPLLFYIPLVPLLWFLRKRLILHPPAGSELGKVIRVFLTIFRRGGLKKLGKPAFWDLAKPTHIAAAGLPEETRWNDQFVEDVKRATQATVIFFTFPLQFINDNGLGSSAGFLSTAMTTDGVPNDVIQNFNTLSIIITAPIVNYLLYPFLRNRKIHFGPIARITTGFALSTIGGAGYAILQQKVYESSPCGWDATNDCEVGTGVSPITIWWMAIPYALGGISEIFVNVPAYSLAYSRSPPGLRSFVSALNLVNTGIAYLLGLIFSALIVDPNLVRVFAVPAGLGALMTVGFYIVFRKIDKEEYVAMTVEEEKDIVLDSSGTHSVVRANSVNYSSNQPLPGQETAEMMISQKQ